MSMRIRLRGKIMLAVIPAVMVIFIAAGILNYKTSAHLITDQELDDLKIVLQQLDTALDVWIEKCQNELGAAVSMLTAGDAWKKGDQTFIRRELKSMSSRHSLIETAWVVQGDESAVLYAGGGPDQDIAGSEMMAVWLNNRSSAGPVFFWNLVMKSPVSGKPVVLYAHPLKSDGRITGYLGAAVLVDDFSSVYLTDLKIGKKGYALLADKDGVTIYHPDVDYLFNVKLKDQAFGREFMRIKNGHLFYEWRGVTKMGIFRTNEAIGWMFILTPQPEEFLAPAAKIKHQALFVGGAAILLAIVAAWFLAGWITKTLKAVSRSLDAVSVGDLSQSLSVKRSDEVGDLVGFLNQMIAGMEQKVKLTGKIASGDISVRVQTASEKDELGCSLQKMVIGLNELIGEIKGAAQLVSTGSDQISESSQALSQGAAEQASALEQITASVAEMNAQTQNHRQTTDHAVTLTGEVKDLAENGVDRMTSMVSAMSEMSRSGEQISGIISVIEDIAFQTNLLALNAAVEAARAGRHGKGFAVVAQEVRHLAGRSAKAAGEINQLIDGTIRKMENGNASVQQTSEALEEMVDGIGRVSRLVEDIAEANNDQVKKISEINHGLTQIEQVTRNNSASAEETASAAEELSSQADHLNRLVTRFRVKESQTRESRSIRAGSNGHGHGCRMAPAPGNGRPAVKVSHPLLPLTGHDAFNGGELNGRNQPFPAALGAMIEPRVRGR